MLSELPEDGDRDRLSFSSSCMSPFPWFSSSEFSSDTDPTMKRECSAAVAAQAVFFFAAPSCCAMAGHEQAANAGKGQKVGRDSYRQDIQSSDGRQKSKYQGTVWHDVSSPNRVPPCLLCCKSLSTCVMEQLQLQHMYQNVEHL